MRWRCMVIVISTRLPAGAILLEWPGPGHAPRAPSRSGRERRAAPRRRLAGAAPAALRRGLGAAHGARSARAARRALRGRHLPLLLADRALRPRGALARPPPALESLPARGPALPRAARERPALPADLAARRLRAARGLRRLLDPPRLPRRALHLALRRSPRPRRPGAPRGGGRLHALPTPRARLLHAALSRRPDVASGALLGAARARERGACALGSGNPCRGRALLPRRPRAGLRLRARARGRVRALPALAHDASGAAAARRRARRARGRPRVRARRPPAPALARARARGRARPRGAHARAG